MNKKRILVLCPENSSRSQMAEGFLRHLAAEKFEVFSSGLNPTQLNPLAVKVMAEVGVDISNHSSKSVMEFIGQRFDYVITVCDNAKQTCPAFPGNYEKIHWQLDDPAAASGSEAARLAVFRKIRDKIKNYVFAVVK